MPDVGIQVPPNLADWWGELVAAGATDLGGLSANGDHISPEHPFPSPHQVRKALQRDGYALTERLCVYPRLHRPRMALAGRDGHDQGEVLELHPAARLGAHRPARADPPGAVPRAIERARAGRALSAEELTAMFAETRPEAIEDMRAAADELRAELAGEAGHLRGQPQHQHLQRVHRRLRLLRLRAGQALPRRLRARPGGLRRAHPRRARLRRQRAVHPVGHPSRLEPRGLPRLAAPGQGHGAPGGQRAAPARLQRDGDRAHVRHLRPAARGGLRAAQGRRPRLHAGHRRGGAARRRARAHLAQQAARGALGGDHRRPATKRACARPPR